MPLIAGMAKERLTRFRDYRGRALPTTSSLLRVFLEDGSYLRLKNVQLGYRLPAHLMSRAGISGIRFFVSAQNIFTVTKYTGLDPELYLNNNSIGDGVRAVGIDWGTYPSARTYTFGVTANF